VESGSDLKRDVVISLCDRTGNIAKPWAEAGYECWCVDMQHPIRKPFSQGKLNFVWGDVRTWTPPSEVRGRIAILFAAPPCTHVAVSGARDFRTKGTGLLRDSLELFSACEHAANWSDAPYMIENPVGKFSDHMGKPDHTFQPWEYGEDYMKRTCLWTGNGFVMPPKTITVKPDHVKESILLMSESTPDRGDVRSVTPMRFANAVYEANGSFPRG